MKLKKTSTHGLTLILDAYNVIHLIPELERTLDVSLENARGALIRYCRHFQESKGNIRKMVLVFDGTRRRESFWDNASSYEGECEIIFSDTDQTADDKIVELLEKLERPETAAVVSSDNYVANNARAHQVRVISVREFEAAVSGGKDHQAQRPVGLDPQAAREITEEYRNFLGLKK